MFRVEVQADNTGTWAGNGLTFDDIPKAIAYAKDLSWRWTLVRSWRVITAAGDTAARSAGQDGRDIMRHIIQ